MKPITGLAVGAVLIPLGLAISLTWLPSSIADALAYQAAGACKEPIPNGSRCWTEVSAVETRTEVVRHSKSSSYYVDLEDGFGTQRVEVTKTSLFEALQPAARVSARFWNGSVAIGSTSPGYDARPAHRERRCRQRGAWRGGRAG